MQPAADRMAEALADVEIAAPRAPVVSNVSAEGETDPDQIRKLLVRQVTGPVRWRESVAWIAGRGTDEFWEIGAGKALSGMIRRIAEGASTRAVATPADVEAAVAETA
jgi:[acyl-carrier-protein] S-malonyltransferase